MTSTTLPSTAALPAAIKATLPSAQADLVIDLFTELQRYRDIAAGAASNARLARSSKIGAGIRQAAGDIAANLRVVHPRFRASMVQVRIENKGPGLYGLERVPDLRTVRAALKQLNSVG